MLLQLCGPNASGKSFIGRELLQRYESTEVWDARWKQKPIVSAYDLVNGLTVLGRYNPGVACGGLEGSFRPLARVAEYAAEMGVSRKFAFGEAMMLSSSRTQLRRVQELMGDEPLVIAVLNTPYELCLERVYQRNGGKAINEGALKMLHKRVNNLPEVFEPEGIITRVIDYQNPVEAVLDVFEEFGWDGAR